MTRPKITASAVLAVYILSGCAGTSMVHGTADAICQVSVVHGPAAPTVHPNPYSSAGSGAATGAATGALSGAAAGVSGGLVGMVILVPLFAIVGAAGGASCGDWVSKHPNADPDFAAIVRAADPNTLVQGLEAQLRAPRAGCAPRASGDMPSAGADALLEVESVHFTMPCPPRDTLDYGSNVKWRAKSARDGKLLRESTSRCWVGSVLKVDEWLADHERARREVEHVMYRLGQRLVLELTLPPREMAYPCLLQARESGEVE